MAKGSSYDSISYGSRITSVEKVYPFKVINSKANHNEYDRKVAKLAWVKELGEALGLKAFSARRTSTSMWRSATLTPPRWLWP